MYFNTLTFLYFISLQYVSHSDNFIIVLCALHALKYTYIKIYLRHAFDLPDDHKESGDDSEAVFSDISSDEELLVPLSPKKKGESTSQWSPSLENELFNYECSGT